MLRSVVKKIAKHWYLYLIWIVLVTLTWDMVFAFLTKVPKEEKVEIFVGDLNDDWDALEQRCEEHMPEYLKKVNIRRYVTSQMQFSEMLQVQGSVADLFILPESKVEEAKMYYLPLDTEKVQDTFGDVEFYELEGSLRGIKINCGETTEDYYLVFGNISMHLGEWNDSDMEGALELAEVILDYGNE